MQDLSFYGLKKNKKHTALSVSISLQGYLNLAKDS